MRKMAAFALCVALSMGPAVVRAQRLPGAPDETNGASLNRRAVAVLPFTNISGSPSDDWVGAGIAETVSADLSRLGMASVVAGEGLIASARGQDATVGRTEQAIARPVARGLGAAWTVTGSFQRVGDQVRIIARIVDVETGEVRRAVTLDGAGDRLFALQDRVVEELRAGFDLTANDGRLASVPSQSPPATNPGQAPAAARTTAVAPRPTGDVTGEASVGDRDTTPNAQIPNAARPAAGGRAAIGFSGVGVPAEVAGTGGEFGSLAGRPIVRPSRTDTPPDVNGRIDDDVWRTAASITAFVQQSPLDGAPATEATEVRLAYDSQNLYLAFHVHYADPSIMRANRVDRDQANEDDLVTVYFDTFLDQQQSFVFDVNGYGVQGDGIINTGGGRGGGRGRRGGGGRGRGPQAIPGPDRSWDALFSSAARIVEDGYTAELAIPFKSLRYPQLSGTVPHRWGFQVVRSIKGKDNEADVWSPMSRDVNGFMTQMGVLEGMTGLSTSRNLEILPTFTAIQFGSLDRTTGTFPEDLSREGGLDVKYGITSNLTANFTYNPDFSQIESDRAQIDVNQRFPLFFSELRPFFLEGQEIFRLSSPVNWVDTRTIVDPRFGAKLTGKVGDVAIGVLAADDEAPGAGLDESDPASGETARVFIGRVRYDLYAESYIGGLVTDREFLNGHSRATGIDGQFRIGQTARFNYMAFQTTNRDLDGVETSGPAWGLFLQRNGRNLRLSSFAGSNHPDSATDVGFLRRPDVQQFWQTGSYRWWPEGWIINWGPRVRYERLYNYDWILEDEKIDTGLDFAFAGNISAGVGVERSLERFQGIDFWKWRYTTNANVATSRRISVGGRFNWGDQIFFSDRPFLGRGVEAGLDIFFRPVGRLQSQINLDSSRLRDIRGGDVEIFDIKIFRALTTYQFTERMLLRNITEFNTFADTVGVNLLLTYRVNAGTVFFVGYDDRYQQRDQFDQLDNDLFLTRALQRTNRAFFAKLQVLFRM